MNIDLGSFAFGNSIRVGGGTPSWGTALGQSQPDYRITYPGAEALVVSLVYNAVPLDAVRLPLGKGGSVYTASETEECQIAALYRKVYINGIRVDYPFIIVLIKEQSKSHNGRRGIKYSAKNEYTYNGEHYENKEFVRKAREVLSISDDACWFVYALEVKNQDELHMYAVVVDDSNSCIYENSSERKNVWLNLIPETTDFKDIVYNNEQNIIDNPQIIFYGAPGTGKSHKIKDNANVKAAGEKNLVYRTTFHPDSDYSTFVGCYKPTMKPVADKYKAVAGKDEEISYSFVPQAFLQAYVAAWNKQEDNVYLVIEEINRGNCAQIFGDLFQLLDRDDDGFSEYPIMADKDLVKYLNGKEEDGQDVLTNKEGIKGGKLMLPPNLHIWATMNTSDQSLFPIDSAFKRRWDWKYIPIKEHPAKNYKIEIGEKTYDWWGFLERINKVIGETTSSEDKKLGYFFVKTETSKVSDEQFVGKVLFYLWNDVFKNYGFDHTIFSKGDKDKFVFSDFFNADGTPNKENVQLFLKRLEDTIKIDRPLDVTPKVESTTISEEATVSEA